ncbi:MAG: hypothetical protein JJU36_04120 [Phycisphaeraceae bacterium]|nr:hypothetical protein [Phycisphaeraceae bacterium]
MNRLPTHCWFTRRSLLSAAMEPGRWGRPRPWLLVFALLCSLSVIAVADDADNQLVNHDVDAVNESEERPPAPAQAMDYSFGGPPLTQREAVILRQTTEDRTTVRAPHNPGFDVLVRHVDRWEQPPTGGYMVPDYTVIHQQPEAMRGKLFSLRGFLVQSDPVQTMTVRGPHTENLTEWVLKLDRDPRKPESIIVYLSDPPDDVAFGDQVELMARFFKLWRNVDTRRGNVETDYPVFVARTADRVAGEARVTPTGGAAFGGGSWTTIITTAVIVLLVFFYFLRRLMRMSLNQPQPLGASKVGQARLRATDTDEEDEEELAEVEPLPESPDAAMEEMARRRERERSL